MCTLLDCRNPPSIALTDLWRALNCSSSCKNVSIASFFSELDFKSRNSISRLQQYKHHSSLLIANIVTKIEFTLNFHAVFCCEMVL